ncbi:LamG domain-containing protein, partial [Algibacter luteus]
MKPTLRIGLTILCLLYAFITNGQTCSGITFNSPGVPSTCTYTYTGSGWEDSSGNPISAPSGNSAGQSICILANNADNFALIKGTLYVGPGATYSGSINGFNNGSTLIIEGDISFPNNTSFSSTNIYLDYSSTFTYPHDFSPGGSTAIHNKGDMYITGDLGISGSAMIVNFEDSFLEVQGDSGINNTLKNCGLFETYGSITGTGGSGLENYCSVYVHQNISLNGDFTNDGLIIIDGTLSVNGSIFYNNDTLVLTNLSLANDQIVGNDVDSLLIVKEHAELSSGASITGHLFLDMDDGGGFDVVCGSCVEEVDIVFAVNVPAATTDILENCGGNIEVSPFIERSTLDFDGVDDYLTTDKFIEGESEVTLMAWVKSDVGNITTMTIAGEDIGCSLFLQNGNIPSFAISTNGIVKNIVSASAINLDEWHHVAGTFSDVTGIMKIYVDGELENSFDTLSTGNPIQNSGLSNGKFEVGRLSKTTGDLEYFKGDIDEVRVFDTLLTDNQIQRIVYQEIENNSGNVKGTIINKDIVDITSGNTISWSNLIAYYPMSDIVSYQRTQDFSLSNRITKLRNITSIQDQTAPMPYETIADGSWTTQSTWLHGDVWDIENTSSNKDWSIVKIANDVTASHTIKNIGLIIDSDKSLTVQGDNQVENSWYLELNGTLDLEGDSQLIQTVNSDLVTSADGKILRRQEGTASP